MSEELLSELATDEHDGATVLAALLEFGQDMDEIGRDELVEDVRQYRDS
jgi:hypothetical protein